MEFTISTSEHSELIDITHKVKELIRESKIKQGSVLVYTPHATAAIIINENYDPNICLDFLDAIEKIVPLRAGWRHDKIDSNAAAHIKAAIIGPSESIPIKDGQLTLGTWQNLMLCEFDGPRSNRKVIICIQKDR